MSGLKVLVSGASIAGPATAYWLAKAGAKVTVIERFPAIRTAGQAVDVRTAGVSVMRRMKGMEAEVRARSTQEEGVCFVRDDGRPYGVIRATGDSNKQSIISEYEIFRGDLARVLYDLTVRNPEIEYVFNEQIASMQQDDGENSTIRVDFMNGKQPTEYDLVVACDGATSRTRAMGLNCSVRENIVPTNMWAAYFSTKEDLIDGSKIGHGFSAPGGRFISVGGDTSGTNRVMLMAIYPRHQLDATLPFLKASQEGDDALRHYVLQHFRDSGWKTDTILQQMMTSEDFYASEIVQVKTSTLHKGRLVLAGDAGYAAGPTGGGTSLALAGAYMLAGELSRHPGDVLAGLRGYEQQMMPLIKELQKIPPIFPAILAPQTAWKIAARNWIFAFVAWTGIAELVQKYLGAAFADTDAFPLPDYLEETEK